MNSNMNPAKAPSWLSREKQENSERREGVERLAGSLKSKRFLLLWTAVESMVALARYILFFSSSQQFSLRHHKLSQASPIHFPPNLHFSTKAISQPMRFAVPAS